MTRSASALASLFLLAACGPAPGEPTPPAPDGGPPPADAGTPDAGALDGAAPDDAGMPRLDAAPPDDRPRVDVEQGTLIGERDGDLRVFRGIPYAAPPVGPLRFRPPQAPAAFDAPFEATAFGPECPQHGRDPSMPFGTRDAVVGDEDCLTLNVWAHDDATPRPVMVWIHGGGFQTGSGSLPTYDGRSLARAADVVIVTINYRLGVLGFLATEDLAAESGEDSAGNYGTRDQIAALGWVQDNIAAFGGDPDNVTIFGESAGGVSTCVLTASPLAEGLFHKVIVESGACAGLPGLRTPGLTKISAIDRGLEIVGAAGCSGVADETACMRALSPEALVRAGDAGTHSILGLADFWPNADGVVLTGDPIELFRDGRRDLPLLIGTNANEATIFTIGTAVLTRWGYETHVRDALGADVGNQVLEIYPASDFASPKAAYNAVISEIAFICPSLAMAEAAAGGEDPAYTYHFIHGLGGVFTSFGAFHGIELPFVFGNYPDTYTPSAEEFAIRDTVQRAWGGFARDGVPDATPTWPAYDPDAPGIFLVDEPAGVASEIVSGRCARLAALGLTP